MENPQKKPQNSETSAQAAEIEKASVPVKPVTVKIEDFRKNLNEVTAESGLPPFLLEMILGEMLTAIGNVAKKEYAQDRASWEKACKEQDDRREEGGENGGH